MNKKLIQGLLDEPETRLEIASWFGFKIDGDDSPRSSWDYDDIMVEALNKLNDILVKGDMITIEISDHIWVRGEYLRTLDDGRLVVDVPELPVLRPIHGKRVDLVIKAKEGEADV